MYFVQVVEYVFINTAKGINDLFTHLNCWSNQKLKFCHHLLPLMSFQTCMRYFLLFNFCIQQMLLSKMTYKRGQYSECQ